MVSSIKLTDRRRWMVAPACGVLSATGFPPLSFWPLTLVALAGFAWVVWRSSGWRGAALHGWLFGVAHFTVANNWIATAFTYQAEMPAALGWAAVPLLSGYLAIYPAIAAGIAKAIAKRSSLSAFAPLIGATWIMSEWLRSWMFTGYSWGPLSLALLGPSDRQGAAAVLPFTGSYALSGLLLTVMTVSLALLAGRHRLLGASIVATVCAAMFWPAPEPRKGSLPYTLVQPNLRQEYLNDSARFEGQFQRIAGLSRPMVSATHRLVLWPESAVPDYLEPGYPQKYYDQLTAGGDPAFARARIGKGIGSGGLLLTGVVNLQLAPQPRNSSVATGAFNSVLALDSDGRIVSRYDKAHLVPYGEYLPMRTLLEPLGMTRLVAGSIDFIPGPGPRTIDFGPWGKASIQICYEIVFSGEVVDRAHRPDYIFNPSNDGWFGSWGPPQFLAQARMRAIEEGLPVLRATTTGISATIDADGIVRDQIGRNEANRIDGLVPPANRATMFARLGHWLTLVWAVLLVAAWGVSVRRSTTE